MKLKKIITAIVLCLCSVFCLAGCTKSNSLTVDDISLVINQSMKTNKERLEEKLIDFYSVDFSCFELNLFGYAKSLSGFCLDEASVTIKQYTNDRKIKLWAKEYSSDGVIKDEVYQVADYTEEGSEVFIEYDLDDKDYKILEREEDFTIAVNKFIFISMVKDKFSFVENIKYEKLVDGKEVFSGIYSSELDWDAYNYVKVTFEDDKIVSINFEEFDDLDGIVCDVFNFEITYGTGDFVVDISECIPK